jgi:Asp-tRNA(Asn)/Glu-tRNA(Gln) amidotransferase A subunit family amidase
MTKDEGPGTITEAAPLIRRGELTPSDLLEQCLDRIDRYEGKVHAWAYLDRERARKDAAQLTDELKKGHFRGPLHGIPVGVKDIIDVFDMPTGCGSKLWANSYAREDATCVRRLRDAGAVIVGKTVTTPFAFFDPSPTRNLWDRDRTPGGSSSGSAAAVAAGMCLAALSSQTGGSTTRPASYCGVCSLKPTYGRISGRGVLPLAPSLDHVGIMARCVRDLAIVFQVVAGPDAGRDQLDILGDLIPVPDCVARLEPKPSAPDCELFRLGGLFEELPTPELLALYRTAVERLESEYAPLKRVVPPTGFAEVLAAQRHVMAVESAGVHAERLARHPDDYPAHIRKLIEEGSAGRAKDYTRYVRMRDDLERQVSGMLHGGRAFLTPATTSLPPDRSTTGDPALNSPWSFTGHPTVSVPAGWSAGGLPYAVQLVGLPQGEADLLRTAAWCEDVFRFPTRPVPD